MCAECYSYPCDPRCPNYEPPPHDLRCRFCDEGMYYEDTYVTKSWEYFCTDCIECLRDEELAYLLEVTWKTATNSTSTCHLCEEIIKKDEIYALIDGKPHHKSCLAELDKEFLMELADVDSDPYRK